MAHEASFREAFEEFIEDKLYQGARPATIHFYRSNVEHFLRDPGITSLEELTLQAIRHSEHTGIIGHAVTRLDITPSAAEGTSGPNKILEKASYLH